MYIKEGAHIMKKIFKRIFKIVILLIFSIFFWDIIKNATIAVKPATNNIENLLNIGSDDIESYIGNWTTDGYKFLGVIDLFKNTGVGYTYMINGGPLIKVENASDDYAIAAYLANCNTGNALQRGWGKVFNSIKKLMSGCVIEAYKNFSTSGNAIEEYKEAQEYAKFCKSIGSGRAVDAVNNGKEIPVNGNTLGPITITKLVKDTNKKGYKFTEGTKNKIIIEANIRGESTKTYTYDVLTGATSSNGLRINGNIAVGSSFTVTITNGKKTSYTSEDIINLKIKNEYKLYHARIFLYGNEGISGEGNPQSRGTPLKSSRRSIFRIWIR